MMFTIAIAVTTVTALFMIAAASVGFMMFVITASGPEKMSNEPIEPDDPDPSRPTDSSGHHVY